MVFTEALRMLITADTAGATRSIQQLGQTTTRSLGGSEKSIDKWGTTLTRVGVGAIAFGGAALVGLGMAAKSAGELEQAVGGTEAVFGDASSIIDKYAKGAADAAGLSETAFRTATTQIGGQLKRMGFEVDDAANKSVELTQVAADLAATYGGTTKEAVEALGSAFRGEADPAERFNLDLKIGKVNAEAVALGLATSTTAVDDHARAQATLSLISKQSADAQGQFARESDTLQGKQQRLAATFENLKAAIGEGALPVFETFLDVAKGGVDIFKGVDDATGGLAGKLTAFGSVGLIAFGGLSLVVGQAIKLRDSIFAARDAVVSFAGSGGLGRLAKGGATVGVILAIREGLNFLTRQAAEAPADIDKLTTSLKRFNQTGEISGEASKILGQDLQKLNDAWGDLFDPSAGDRLEHVGDELRTFGGLLDQSDTEVEEAKKIWGEFDEALAGVATDDPARALEILADVSDRLGLSVDAAKAKLPEYAAAVDASKAAAADAGTAVDEYGVEVGESGDAAAAAEEKISVYKDALQAQFDPIFGVISAQQGLNDALAKQAEVYANAESTALEKASADQAVREAVVDLDGAAGNLNRRIADGSLTVADARERFITMATQMGVTRDDAIRLADGMLITTSRARDLGNTDPNVRITASDHASPVFKRVRGRLVDLDGRTASILIQTTHRTVFEEQRRGFTTSGPQIMHEGGVVPGRRGEEVAAILQAGEGVVPLSEMSRPMSAAGGGGGGGLGGVVHNHFHMEGAIISSRDDAARWVAQAHNKAQRLGLVNR